jgi:hypothetical protein
MLPLFFGFFTVKSLELFTTGKRLANIHSKV